MPICAPCVTAAAAETRSIAEEGADAIGHSPEICIDSSRTEIDIALHGRACPCNHLPVGSLIRHGALPPRTVPGLQGREANPGPTDPDHP